MSRLSVLRRRVDVEVEVFEDGAGVPVKGSEGGGGAVEEASCVSVLDTKTASDPET